VLNSARIALAISKRFHTFRNGIKTGAAEAKTDEFVELTVHPKYRDNIARYVQVVRAVALEESVAGRTERIARLKRRLLDPVTAAEAAMELEAIGSEGAEALLEGIETSDPEVRFYSAEALAYLDRSEAAEPLAEAARTQPAFRVFALTALSALNDYMAYEQLQELLAVPSAETRYGAFRALWAMNPADALVTGQRLGEGFSYHVLNVGGPPMIHATRSRRPEIVVFGPDQRLLTPLALNAGNQVMITSRGPDEITVSRFSVGKPDQRREVSTRVDDVIRAIAEVGGTYPDVVQALQEAKARGLLPSRFEVDALPTDGRAYDRMAGGQQEADEPAVAQRRDGDPPAVLSAEPAAADPTDQLSARQQPGEQTTSDEPDSGQRPHWLAGLFARIMGRDSE
jgi:hypothetical protein